MAGNTEESARFKKTVQTVNGGGNNKLVGSFNDQIFKEHQGSDGNINNEPRSANSRIEKDLETKGYSTHATDGELDETKEMREKLSKRGNLPQSEQKD